ncbi:MAG: flagellin [Thermoguttaceae bacterium]|jgi:flagellin
MTRINTNISSLTAQNNLAKANNDLQTAMTRLSTGLRINSGSDDPSGLIAAAQLGSEISSTNQAISNTTSATNMIDTADTALSQVTTLLNTIQTLITQTANDATISDSQKAANQTQIDSALDAINRIAQTTSYQGRNLLDGSLDYNTKAATSSSMDNVNNLQINSALVSNQTSSVDGTVKGTGVTISVGTAATQGTVSTNGITSAAAPASATIHQATNIVVTAAANGTAYNGVSVKLVSDTADLTAGAALANYNATAKTLTIYVNDSTAAVTNTTLANAVSAATTAFTVTAGALASGETVNTTAVSTTAGSDSGITGAVSFTLTGNQGSHTFNFSSGTTGVQMQDAINLLTNSTGVVASYGGTHTLTLKSSNYGSSQSVKVSISSDTTNTQEFTTGFGGVLNASGSDIVATVNGLAASGNGNTLSVNTGTLSMSATMATATTGDSTFTITGGGATFQLGANITTNNQATLGIQNVGTSSLGGTDGLLYQLASGSTQSLTSGDLTTSSNIVTEALNQVTALQGRLGAFQKETLEANSSTLASTVTALTSAQSNIQDADFATETANLTRAQILVQSGTAVLKIANKNPENVLTLLQ